MSYRRLTSSSSSSSSSDSDDDHLPPPPRSPAFKTRKSNPYIGDYGTDEDIERLLRETAPDTQGFQKPEELQDRLKPAENSGSLRPEPEECEVEDDLEFKYYPTPIQAKKVCLPEFQLNSEGEVQHQVAHSLGDYMSDYDWNIYLDTLAVEEEVKERKGAKEKRMLQKPDALRPLPPLPPRSSSVRFGPTVVSTPSTSGPSAIMGQWVCEQQMEQFYEEVDEAIRKKRMREEEENTEK